MAPLSYKDVLALGFQSLAVRLTRDSGSLTISGYKALPRSLDSNLRAVAELGIDNRRPREGLKLIEEARRVADVRDSKTWLG